MPEDGHNPYSPPTADLGPEAPHVSRRIGWKIYFWIMATLTAGVGAGFVAFGRPQALDLPGWMIGLGGFVGLFGYAHRRAFFGAKFWMAWFPLQVVWDTTSNLVLAPQGLVLVFPGIEPSTPAESALGMLFLLPFYLALYRYAFRSPELWRRAG